MLFYQPQEFVNSLLLMRFGVKGFSVRDEWKIVPIELKNIMHSNCKPLLFQKTTQHSGLLKWKKVQQKMSSQTKVNILLLLMDDVFKSCTVEKTSKNIILAPETAVSQYITFFQNLYYYAYGRGHVIPVFKTCFFLLNFFQFIKGTKKCITFPPSSYTSKNISSVFFMTKQVLCHTFFKPKFSKHH